MKPLIKKILRESEEWFDQLDLQSNLPFEISQNPRNRPKITNMFIMKTGWDDGDRYLREDFSFKSDDDKSFELFMNVCRFYSKLLDNQNKYGRWQDVDRIVKSLGLSISSYDEDDNYGTSKDMSDYVFGTDYPANLDSVEISYYDQGGVEYEVQLKFN
jgi:hypothetical protein